MTAGGNEGADSVTEFLLGRLGTGIRVVNLVREVVDLVREISHCKRQIGHRAVGFGDLALRVTPQLAVLFAIFPPLFSDSRR